MFDKSTQYSYRAQKNKRYRLFKFFLIFIILFTVYNCLTTFFFSVWVIENNTMQPGLAAGDRLIFTSFVPPAFFNSRSKDENNGNPYNLKRGSIVLVDMGQNKKHKLPLRIVDGAVRFFTLQKISIFSRERQYYVKRVIALPGDEISMSNYIFRVKTENNAFSLTEFELSERPYHPAIPESSSIWDDTVPFSGNMEPVILKADECFVISDDRSNTNDSRTWGVISPSLITAKAIFRFWPLSKIERL